MQISKYRWFNVVALGLTVATCAGPGTRARPIVAPAPLRAEALLQALHELSGVPGMGAAVWHDGQIAWAGSAGHRDLALGLAVQADTRFRLASVSKVLTATAAALLSEQGLLDLDAPLTELLPWLHTGWPAITPRQLAAHVSGLPHYQAVDAARGSRHYANSREPTEALASRSLLGRPGERYSYSSWGYTVLGAVVEQRSGRPLLEVLRRGVAQDLAIGADATDAAGASALQTSRAYVVRDDRWAIAPAHDYSYCLGGAGLSATPIALARWGGAVLAGQVVSAATRTWVFEPTLLSDGTPVLHDDRVPVAFGWRVDTTPDGDRIAYHSGATTGARSVLMVWPDRGVAVSLLSNAAWIASIEATARVLAAPFLPVPQKLVARECPVAARRWSGTLGAEPLSGAVRIHRERGHCELTLTLDHPMAVLRNDTPRHEQQLRLLGLDDRGGLARAALVTPIGLFELRAQPDGSLHAEVAGRPWSMRFADHTSGASRSSMPHSSSL